MTDPNKKELRGMIMRLCDELARSQGSTVPQVWEQALRMVREDPHEEMVWEDFTLDLGPLYQDSEMLRALESAGVDSWEGYEHAQQLMEDGE